MKLIRLSSRPLFRQERNWIFGTAKLSRVSSDFISETRALPEFQFHFIAILKKSICAFTFAEKPATAGGAELFSSRNWFHERRSLLSRRNFTTKIMSRCQCHTGLKKFRTK